MSGASFWKVLGLLALLVAPAFPHTEQSPGSTHELLPVPKSLEQGRFDRPLREQYKAQFASRDAGERGELGRKLHAQAATEKDPAARFVLLREARDLAVDAGDFVECMQIIDEIGKTFAIDSAEMKANALAIGVDKSRLSPMELAGSYMKVAEYAKTGWDLDIASKSAYLATKLASGNRELSAQAKSLEKTIRLLNHDLVATTAAMKKLEKTPDDPASNQTVGRFLCFAKDQWDKGLPYLAKAASPTLKTIAQHDLAAPSDPAEMSALADSWWEFADPRANLPPACGHRRAAYWYAKALPGLNGEKKADAEKHLKEMENSSNP